MNAIQKRKFDVVVPTANILSADLLSSLFFSEKFLRKKETFNLFELEKMVPSLDTGDNPSSNSYPTFFFSNYDSLCKYL